MRLNEGIADWWMHVSCVAAARLVIDVAMYLVICVVM